MRWALRARGRFCNISGIGGGDSGDDDGKGTPDTYIPRLCSVITQADLVLPEQHFTP